MLDLRRLTVFREVTRQGSFSRAALELSYSQAVVSHHVRGLERELNARLLDRGNGAAVTLTAAGATLMRYADDVLDLADTAEAAVGALVRQSRGEVQIACFSTAASTIVADAMVRVRRHSSEIKIGLLETEGPAALDALRANQAQLALIFDDEHHPLAVEDRIETRLLYNDPFLVALPLGHPQARREEVHLGSLAGELWIQGAGPDTPCSRILRDACSEVGFEPKVAVSSGNYSVVRRLVANGAGVALIPALAVNVSDPDIVVRRLRPQPMRRVFIAHRGDSPHSSATARMLTAIEEVCVDYAEASRERVPELSGRM